MGAIKGWAGAVATIVQNRKEKVQVSFDLTKRIDLRAANKKALENLILAGGFDSFRERCGLNIFMMRVMELPL
jgi:DNA polymerase-3 subunit alpha